MIRLFALSLFSAIVLLIPGIDMGVAHAQAPRVLCFTDIDCPDDTMCQSVGSMEGGRGVCRSTDSGGGILTNPIEADSLVELLTAFVRGVVRVAAIFLVLAFVWVGFKFTAAQGNTEKLSEARMLFLWTVVGAAILLGAELIAGVVVSTVQTISP